MATEILIHTELVAIFVPLKRQGCGAKAPLRNYCVSASIKNGGTDTSGHRSRFALKHCRRHAPACAVFRSSEVFFCCSAIFVARTN